jgi:hypothetical protein
MSFKELLKEKKEGALGGLIGLIIGIIVVNYTLTYQGECWECILFLLPLIPFESIFERISNGAIQVILGYGFLIMEYLLIGVFFGFIVKKIKSKSTKKKK